MRLRLQRSKSCGTLIAGLATFFIAPLAFAANIDLSYPYAWGNVTGWVNFNPSQAGITVTNSAVTGYVWSQNTGWINFSPAQSGVTNNNGTLGGFAWDETAGWISFSGVTIDSAGKFHGQATGGTIGGINYALTFDCTQCDVRTSWVPTVTPSTPVATPTAGGGGIISGPSSVGTNTPSAASVNVGQASPAQIEPTTPKPVVSKTTTRTTVSKVTTPTTAYSSLGGVTEVSQKEATTSVSVSKSTTTSTTTPKTTRIYSFFHAILSWFERFLQLVRGIK